MANRAGPGRPAGGGESWGKGGLAAIGQRAARRLGRSRPFSAPYVLRVLRAERGGLQGSGARMIRQVAKAKGLRVASRAITVSPEV